MILKLTLILIITSKIEARTRCGSDHGHHSREYFDLSYSINKDTIFFPGNREFSLNKDYDGINKSGIWYSSFSFCMGEHGGTHIDSPFHFNKEGWTLDKIPPSHLIDIPAALIDVSDQVNNETNPPDQFILEVRHLIKHERTKDSIPVGGVVLIHTGWSKYWPDKIKYLGWDNSTEGTQSNLHFPGVSEDAAKWLANERQIVGLGIDTPSVDPGSTQTYPVHVLFAERQIYNIENVANLHTILRKPHSSECQLHLFVMPLKIIGATGSPARILAYCK